jgi:uncharacterized surface protein with fasciclin (FAS1) repeats
MKKTKIIRFWLYPLLLLLILNGMVFLVSCKDEYLYDDKEPEWLGASIYDYLEQDGHFTYYLSIINSVSDAGIDYADVLRKTGNKTLFVANDEAFETFFKNNEYGIRNFDQMSNAMRRAILFSGMLDDTYLMEMMSSISATPPAKGQAMRRLSSLSVLDTIPFETGGYLPDNPYWERFKEKGLYVLRDDSRSTMVHFLPAFLSAKGITGEDVRYITNTDYTEGDNFIFGIKIIEKDITCKNGYVNVLERLMLPPDNLAQYVRSNADVRLFNSFLERYCAPYYSPEMTLNYKSLHPEFSDSIFVKRFFTETQNRTPENAIVEGVLNYDPGWNAYSIGSSSLETDMAAMFAPTDKALNEYFNDGEGKFLKDRYGAWKNVPNDVLNILLNNHMRASFVASVPSKFSKMEDKMGTPIGVEPEDIQYANVCSNGIVYITNKVYPSSEYASVMAPVIVGANTRIFNWAIATLQFDLYLLSMDNKFTFIVPTDEYLSNYLNPVSVGKPVKERWRFRYDPKTVNVTVAIYNQAGDSTGTVSSAVTQNALLDILDNHIILGDIVPGKIFYQTKGGATLKVTSEGGKLRVEGAGNIEQGTIPLSANEYTQKNGTTYLMNNMLQSSVRSVYNIMSSEARFSRFFDLCQASEPLKITVGQQTRTYGGTVFYKDPSFAGIDYNVSFFNTFNYTVYIPTNEAVDQAIRTGVIKTWDEISALQDIEKRGEETQKLYNFLRYHFQDNSVYISGEAVDRSFETATLNPEIDKFFRIAVKGDGTDLTLTTAGGGTAHVVKQNNLYNIMARDYKFNNGDITRASTIETSSFAVIHQIDAVLNYQ